MNRQTYLQIRQRVDLRINGRLAWAHGAIDFGLLGLIGIFGMSGEIFATVACAPLISALMFRQYSWMHDAAHGAVSKKRWFNDLVGAIGGVFCLLPFDQWKKSHIAHHHWAGNIERDPVMGLLRVYPLWTEYFQKFLSALWRGGFPILAFLQNIVFWKLSINTFFREKKTWRSFMSLFLPPFALITILTLTPPFFSLVALLPALLLYLVAVEVVNLPHHLQIEQEEGDTRLMAWEQHQTARTCIYPDWFARGVVLNFNYHIEHHLFPDAPWYHLESLHREVKAELGDAYRSDPYFHWILKNKRCSLDEVLLPRPRYLQKKRAA